MIAFENGERWHHTPIGRMVAGPCPRCLRNGKRLNTCKHQLPEGLGYVVASFDLASGVVTEVVDG
jgi:hypothetical protein